MVDGIGLLVGAKVYIKDDGDASTVDTIPLTEPIDIFTQDKHTLQCVFILSKYINRFSKWNGVNS